jgi:hypothetical protein
MTRYSGPFPVLLLRLFGSELAVLRITSVLCNGAALLVLAAILRRIDRLSLSGMALLATLPVWLIHVRNGIEVVMFAPLLSALGVWLLMFRSRFAACAAGLAFGLSAYNHLLGAFIPASLLGGWLLTHRALPRIAWLPALAGFALGFAPRIAALILYRDRSLDGDAANYSVDLAMLDLPILPWALWSTLGGGLPYLRFAGKELIKVIPYFALAAALFIRWREIPKLAWTTLAASLLLAVLTTVATPRLSVHYLMFPAIGLTFLVVQLGSPRIAAALTAFNLFYLVCNFYLPWARNDLAPGYFFLGVRNAKESNRPYLPKDALTRKLVELAPEQIITTPSLERPLRALLQIKVVLAPAAEKGPRTMLLTYDQPDRPAKSCADSGRCFTDPIAIDNQYLVYRSEAPY